MSADTTAGTKSAVRCSWATRCRWLPIVAFVTATGCKERPRPEPTRPPPVPAGRLPTDDGLRTFRDRAVGHAFDFPAAWKLTDHTRGAGHIRADVNHGETGLQVRVLDRGKRTFRSFVDWYVDQFVDDMVGYWRGDMREERRTFDRDGETQSCPVSLSFDRADGQRWLFKQYLWTRGGRVVVFQAGTPWAKRAEGQLALDAIAASFSFED